MLPAILLAAGLLGPCENPQGDPLRTVCPYLDALQRLDHEAMAGLWAPDVVWVQTDGSRPPLDRERTRDFRDFEREMHGRWFTAVDSTHGDSAFITRREANDFYDLLGVGDRTQREMYVVRGGRIGEMHILSSFQPGPDYDSVYAAFKRWVLDTLRVRDPKLVGDDVLRFTGKSAPAMRGWLERWRS